MSFIRTYLLEISLFFNLATASALLLVLFGGYGRRPSGPPKIYREETPIDH